jgi:ribosomal protein S18 acetylase RimI-like enzyme
VEVSLRTFETSDLPILEQWIAPDEAVLGILLGDQSIFGRGIGRRAIELAMEQLKCVVAVARITLNVRTSNARAISCYLRCGFKTIRTSEKQLADGAICVTTR